MPGTTQRERPAMSQDSNPYSIDVSVETLYIKDQSSPEEDQYLFAYTVTIRNTGTIAAKLKTRHWIITDSNGKVEEVRGEGVVGEQPHMQPGEGFRYTSAALLQTPVGAMQGSYQMLADDGVEFDAPIAPFSLTSKAMLH